MAARIVSVVLVFVVTVLVSGPLNVLVYAKGLAFTLGPAGVAAHVPAIALMVALLGLVLVKLRKLSKRAAGFELDARALALGSLAMVATALWLVIFVAVMGALLGSPLQRSANAISPGALALAAVSFIASSLVQQLSTQSFVRAASPNEEISRGGVAVGVVIFTLAHAGVTPSAIYLCNVALFGLATTLLFTMGDGRRAPSYALATGMHAGWNFAQIALLGAPFGGFANPVAVWRWPSAPAILVGGSNGFDEGVLFSLACLPFVLLGVAGVRRVAARA